MKEHTCCFTGHRDIKDPEKYLRVILATLNALFEAENDGYTRFITGLAEGADTIFAKNVILMKYRNPWLKLVAAISHQGRLDSKDTQFQRLLAWCDEVNVLSQVYHGGVYAARNRWMLENSSRLIAVWDGRLTGGTYRTIKLAEKMGIDIRRIDPNNTDIAYAPDEP